MYARVFCLYAHLLFCNSRYKTLSYLPHMESTFLHGKVKHEKVVIFFQNPYKKKKFEYSILVGTFCNPLQELSSKYVNRTKSFFLSSFLLSDFIVIWQKCARVQMSTKSAAWISFYKKILLLLHFLFSRNFFSRSQAKIHFSDRFPVVFLSCQAILRFTGTVKAKKVFCFPYTMMQSRVVSSHVEGPVAGLGLTARIICQAPSCIYQQTANV